MKSQKTGVLGVVADIDRGQIVATVEIAASPERVFRALTSAEIVDWWVRPGVFDTRLWEGDVRVGGRWSASGLSRGEPYTVKGEYLEVDPPRKLVHTWRLAGIEEPPTTVTFILEQVEGGTRLTLQHTGFSSPDRCTSNCVGWETSLGQLIDRFRANHLTAQQNSRGDANL